MQGHPRDMPGLSSFVLRTEWLRGEPKWARWETVSREDRTRLRWEEKVSGLDGKENEWRKGRRQRREDQGDRSECQKGNPREGLFVGRKLKRERKSGCFPGTQVQGNHALSVTNPYLPPTRSSHACSIERAEGGVLAEPWDNSPECLAPPRTWRLYLVGTSLLLSNHSPPNFAKTATWPHSEWTRRQPVGMGQKAVPQVSIWFRWKRNSTTHLTKSLNPQFLLFLCYLE